MSSAKVVVVTGASSGIGASLVQFLVERGDNVVLVSRREAALRAVVESCDGDKRAGKMLVAVADMTDREQVANVVGAALKEFKRIDVWINNAGVGITRLPSQLTGEDIDMMMDANVKSAMYGMQEILPHFKERQSGHIINVSSVLGRLPLVTIRSAYVGAKHFLNALTATFREEVQQTHPGIQFSLVSPGVVATEFGVNALHGGPDSRTMPDSQTAEEVAHIIVTVVETRAPDLYTRTGTAERVANYYANVGQDPVPP